jgi:exodeoxyribonuclease VII small subunit
VNKKPAQLPNLEVSLAEISELIEKMEQSDQTLEQSLIHFERGITLIKHCQKILVDAEQKVQILVQENQDTATLTPFDNKDENSAI